MLHVERINAVSVCVSACLLIHFFCPLCRQLDADIMLLSLYLKEFSKLLVLSNTTSHLHFVTVVFYLKASIFKQEVSV